MERKINEIIVRLQEIVDSVPTRDKRGNTDEEIEEFYNSIEAIEDAFIEVVEDISPDNLCLKPGLLDQICRLAIKADGVYVEGEDKDYSGYQDRLPFRLYEQLEWWTVPIPKLLMDELKRHLPNIRL